MVVFSALRCYANWAPWSKRAVSELVLVDLTFGRRGWHWSSNRLYRRLRIDAPLNLIPELILHVHVLLRGDACLCVDESSFGNDLWRQQRCYEVARIIRG